MNFRSSLTHRRSAFAVALLAASAACGSGDASSRATNAPPTRAETTATVFHGERVADPYRWLEHGDSADVKAWTGAQNTRTDSVLATYSEAATITHRVEELANTSPDRSTPSIAGGMLFYLRQTPPQPQPVLVAEPWPSGSARTLVDVNGAGGNVAITGYWTSPTGRYVAYATATGGNEIATLHFVDVRSGRILPDSLTYAGGGTSAPSVAWDADERGVLFTRFPVPAAGTRLQEFDVAVLHHTLGSGGEATAAVGEGASHVAMWQLLAGGGESAALLYKGDGTFADVYQQTAAGWRRTLDDRAGIVSGTVAGGRLLLIATAGSPRGRLIAVTAGGDTSAVLPEGEWAMQSISAIAGGLLVARTLGMHWRIDHFGSDGRLIRSVGLPAEGISVGVVASSAASREALITYSGWATPTHWMRYDGASGALTAVFEVKPAADYSRIVAHNFEATSVDGTKIPVTVLELPGTPHDGSAPAIMTAYGGFRATYGPRFVGTSLAWLERGGILAYADVRGGSDYGEGWHQGGIRLQKQHSFDDFHAAAVELVRQQWTSADRLGITGGSNGGLLVGGALAQHPESYRAVVSFVGIYDMLRHELFPNGTYNMTEYGATSDSTEFAALRAYSPLHAIRPGVKYPAVLMETGLNDPRVASWQSRKFTAALQASTASGLPVLLLTRSDAGHGIGAPFSQRVGNAAIAITFFAHQLAPEISRNNAK